MRDFHCPNCGQRLTFENSACLSCGSALGFSLEQMALLVIAKGDEGEHAGAVDADDYQLCANLHLAECNWLVPKDHPGGLCASCALTTERPNDDDTAGLAEFARAEAAKRRLIAELHELKLPIVGRDQDPDYGLAFRLLSSAHEKVMTGHENGVITLDLAEGDDVHREQLRVEMDEPYRTLLGHFRHEIGHYYFYRLITPSSDYLARFNELFGDPDADYQRRWTATTRTARPRVGRKDSSRRTRPCIPPRTGPRRSPITCTSATPWTPRRGAVWRRRRRPSTGRPWAPALFQTIIEMWLPLSWSLNMVNRSMGHDDLYPFVLPVAVLDKMQFIHTVIDEVTSESRGPAAIAG